MRYYDTQQADDLAGCREHLAEAIRLGGRKDPDAAMYRQQFAAFEGTHWSTERAKAAPVITAVPAEVRKALRMAREALEMTEEGSPHLPVRLVLVAEFLGQGVDGPGGLSEAVKLAERAVAVAHPDDPRRSRYHNAHAQALLRLAEHRGDRSMAVKAQTSAVRAGQLAHPYDPLQVGIVQTLHRARALASG
ncbi:MULTISPECIES: hypothetical protein [unclassified Nocardiopsis]|uniref:hypothetical protein n=1 Tax=unclassified Nocardiopsis TaxID=2649073 RepID=UPI001F246D11|nr:MULTISPECIES: hypothetical protein [unclassified Nocardiopsis]